jgi:adenylosuccinate synthase
MRQVHIVVGGQFGSEGKGAFTAALFSRLEQAALKADRPVPMTIRVGGPNAGHTAFASVEPGPSTHKDWSLRHVPVAAVRSVDSILAIAAGSEIDEEVLLDELGRLDHAGFNATGRLIVDWSCTRIEPEDGAQEHDGLVERIGSTGKGIGQARARRIMREASLYGGDASVLDRVMHHLEIGGDIIIEGTQGYGLSLHGEAYPFTTSRDCRAIDFLAEVGIPPWHHDIERIVPWLVLRTYPIRVAGNSGPMHEEISWDELAERSGGHIQPEYTTVTKKMRRVGEWDPILAGDACQENGWPHVALMFYDYIYPDLANRTEIPWDGLKMYRRHVGHSAIMAVGTGPDSMAWHDLAP